MAEAWNLLQIEKKSFYLKISKDQNKSGSDLLRWLHCDINT